MDLFFADPKDGVRVHDCLGRRKDRYLSPSETSLFVCADRDCETDASEERVKCGRCKRWWCPECLNYGLDSIFCPFCRVKVSGV